VVTAVEARPLVRLAGSTIRPGRAEQQEQHHRADAEDDLVDAAGVGEQLSHGG
jgi:hypothetical protein